MLLNVYIAVIIAMYILYIYSSRFIDNHALLGGSAIGFLSRTRVDVANLPTIIENW